MSSETKDYLEKLFKTYPKVYVIGMIGLFMLTVWQVKGFYEFENYEIAIKFTIPFFFKNYLALTFGPGIALFIDCALTLNTDRFVDALKNTFRKQNFP